MEEDIIDLDGALTARYLLSRGYCCGNGCRNCPYLPRHGGPEALPPEDIDRLDRVPRGVDDPIPR